MTRRRPSSSRRSARLTRRGFLRGVAGGALALPFWNLATQPNAHAMDGPSRRLIVFYFPDGVPGTSGEGQPSLWNPSGSEFGFRLPDLLSPLTPWQDHCVFTTGLSMGGTDAGSHPGGAKKLLTAVDSGNGESFDQVLARTVGADRPHRHVYLGVQSNANGASGDKHISYVAPGVSTPPVDNPVDAFERLFTGASGDIGGGTGPRFDRELSLIDGAMDELDALRSVLDERDAVRMDLHLESLREVESRLQQSAEAPPSESCASPSIDVSAGRDASALYDPARFPELLRTQIDVLVTAMACDLTRVGVLQASMHTSELIMSRFPDTEMFDAGFDMRSHQASHYGNAHDFTHREFRDYVFQRRWFVSQFAYLLEQLAVRPEGEGSMLDHSTVLLCSEVSDGNLHTHDDMPFIIAGAGGGRIRTGRLLDFGYRRHGDLLAALGNTLGANFSSYGDAGGSAVDLG